MQPRLLAQLAWAGVAWTAACGDAERTDDSATRRLARVTSTVTDAICACAPGPQVDACLASSAREIVLSDCERELLDRPEAAAAMACVTDRFERMAACFEENGCSAIASQLCLLDVQAQAVCRLPPDLEHERESCPGHEPFVCDDGQRVSRFAACDGFPECDDGSDEQRC